MLIACYGTLKQGFTNHYVLGNDPLFIGEFTTPKKYTMYDLGGFPAIAQQGNTAIHCELYSIDDPKILKRIDALEGYISADSIDNFYNKTQIKTQYGEAVIYIIDNPKWEISDKPVIESGLWIKNKNQHIMEPEEILHQPAVKILTHCCALSQISAGNSTPIEEIKRLIQIAKHEKQYNWLGKPKGFGERAFFCIISPGEEELENKLKLLQFKQISKFNRRAGYPVGILKMYFYNF